MKRFNDFNQLKEGDCIVIATNGTTEKEFKGKFNSKINVLFFAIPNNYEVVGYIQ